MFSKIFSNSFIFFFGIEKQRFDNNKKKKKNMGIPGYFPWLLSCYPRIIGNFPKRPDNVYIDVNGLIHECCRQDGNYSNNEEESIKRLLDMVETMIKDMDPQILVYLSIDGVAPMAKANQQRTRRYSSTGERTASFIESTPTKCVPPRVGQLVRCNNNTWGNISSLDSDSAVITTCISHENIKTPISELSYGYADVQPQQHWDSNAVSCGTAFMDKATAALQQMAGTMSETSKFVVIIDGVRCPGEGEHKFVDFIKKGRQFHQQGESSKTLYKPNQTHVFVSGDADLLLLGLAVHEPGVIVARQTGLNEYDFVYIKHLRDYLAEHLLGVIGKCRAHHDKVLIQKSAKIAALAIVAASGLSHLRSPYTSSTRTVTYAVIAGLITYAVYTLLTKRAQARQVQISKTVDIERVINDFVTLSLLVGSDFAPRLPPFSAGDHSMSSIVDVYCKTISQCINSKESDFYLVKANCSLDLSVLSALLRNLAIVEQSSLKSIRHGNWSDVYYRSIAADKKTRDGMCEEYLKYISWGAGYYLTDSVPSWKWSYPFHYSPTVASLREHVERLCKFQKSYIFEDSSKPLLPEQQLVRILPPASFVLHRPDILQKIIALGTEPFPGTWQVDSADKYGTSLMSGAADELVFPIDNATCDDALEQHNPKSKNDIPDVTKLKNFGSSTTIAHKLTNGTNESGNGEIIAVRRPCYIPWREEGFEYESLQQSNRSFKLYLKTKDGGRLPHVSRDLPRNFGIPAPRITTSNEGASVNIGVLDAPRLKQFIADGKDYMTIRGTKVLVELRESECEISVKVQSTQAINIRGLVSFFKSAGISPGYITLRKQFGCATFPTEAKNKDAIKRLESQGPHRFGSALLKVCIEPPSKRLQMSPVDYPVSQFFSPSTNDCSVDWACHYCKSRNYRDQKSCKHCSAPKDEANSFIVVARKYGTTAAAKIDRTDFVYQLSLFHSRPTEVPEEIKSEEQTGPPQEKKTNPAGESDSSTPIESSSPTSEVNQSN